MDERIRPKGRRYEKSVLSTLLQNGVQIEGASLITPEHFECLDLRLIYIEMLAIETAPVDLVEFYSRMEAKGLAEQMGGSGTISNLYGYATSDIFFQSHLSKLHMLKARRAQIDLCKAAIDAAYEIDDDNSFLSFTGEPMTQIHDIAAATTNSRTKKQIMDEVMEDFKKRVMGQESSLGIKSGFPSFDQYLRGLHPQRITVISGLPSAGKTLIANQIGWAAAQEGHPTLVMSLEMGANKLCERNIIFGSDLPPEAFTEPVEYAKANGNDKPTKDHLKKIAAIHSEIYKAPIQFEDPSNCTINQITATIRRHHRKYGTKVVIIDYLQIIKGEKGLSREQQLSEISHSLQSIAKELGLSLILLSQQNKEGGTKHAESITEDADLVLAIIKDLDKESDTFGHYKGILVRKDRHYGNNGLLLPIYFIKERVRFEEHFTSPYDQ